MKQLFIALILLWISTTNSTSQTKTIAHRGYWDCEGSAQNSIAALKKANFAGVYGSEFDVKMTSDGILVINHDDSIGGFFIEKTPYAKIKNLRLKNGEKLPTLDKYLSEGKKLPNLKLILEIKSHSTKEIEDRVVSAILKLVNKHQLVNKVEYISFSMNICKELIKLSPKSQIAYLDGILSPKELKEIGFTGLDYHYSEYERNPNWIQEAKNLGLTTNVWTVNDPNKMKILIDQGVDYITTDKPIELQHILMGN